MRVAISGSSGLIGSALEDHLGDHGHEIVRMVRSEDDLREGDILWSVADGRLDPEDLRGCGAVFHFAAAPIDSGPWTDEIRDSRVDGTRLVAEAVASLDDGPDTLVAASAVGWYGSRGDEVLTEDSSPGDGFLAEMCKAWEQAAQPARNAGLRVVHPRTGVILAEGSPLIDKVQVPFKLGVGGRVGSGRQWIPWITLTDEVRALEFLLEGDLEGPVNLVGPDPVQNLRLTKALGSAWHRPTIFPVPVFAVRLLYGEVGATLATESQRAIPERLVRAGFTFRHPTVEAATEAALA